MPSLIGYTSGLKPNQIRKLTQLYRRKNLPSQLISPELARSLTELSLETGRQVGLLIHRQGGIEAVIIGDEREIVIPDLSAYRLGGKRLRGLRCIHTHLKHEPLTQDDLTDLALLRLDFMAVIEVLEDGLPGFVTLGYLVPPDSDHKVYEILPPVPFHQLKLPCDEFISDLEKKLTQAQSTFDIHDPRERALLVSVSTGDRMDQEDSLEELKELARSDNLLILDAMMQRPKSIHPKYLLGSGKVKEVVIKALQAGATLLVFDQSLSPGQAKAIGELSEMKVIDRNQLILDIFAQRAKSREGKVQVELAQLKYLLPKLSERSTDLSRLTGGIGGRGPGETRLEIDRRRVREKIGRLEKELRSLTLGREQRRMRRKNSDIPILSIVGYTNVGKSTLLNILTKSDVTAEDLLFATLDTASRRLRFPREREVIITDTVGFIRDLPKDLFAAFAATLDELQDSDLLLHVADMSNPRVEQQIKAVESILAQLHLETKPRLLILNKMDKMDPETVKNLTFRLQGIPVSALHPESLENLLLAMEEKVFPPRNFLE
ncbi:MAG: GTPase HflX [Nitrospirae bacterium]|nr:GTPase HflX [Nitrospirota bacterium]MBI3595311.1 GTPase HflX [Nitrospirota bacterium]